jgi:hypothetical protein
VEEIGGGLVAIGEFIVRMVACDDEKIGIELLIVDMLDDELQRGVRIYAAQQSLR